MTPAEKIAAGLSTRERLLGLAERVEAATGVDREIDEAIQAALAGAEIEPQGYCSSNTYHRDGYWVSIGDIKPYTASIDAAMSLVPEGWLISISQWPIRTMQEVRDRPGDWGYGKDQWRVTLTQDGSSFGQVAPVAAAPALALTAAALRARAAMEEQS